MGGRSTPTWFSVPSTTSPGAPGTKLEPEHLEGPCGSSPTAPGTIRFKKRRVYIHCRQGKVRSVCVTLCYLMRCGLTLNEAMARVRLFGRDCRQLIDERQVSFRAVCTLVEDEMYRGTSRGGGYRVGPTKGSGGEERVVEVRGKTRRNFFFLKKAKN
jgi:hypothetical protein